MSWGTCYSGSNNIHFNYPPIMADGRNFASWQPGAVINEKIRQESGIKSNWQYRNYLIENADHIIKYNQLGACDESSNSIASYGGAEQLTGTPFLYNSYLENYQIQAGQMQAGQIQAGQMQAGQMQAGQPFGYENSDLKNSYLTRQQLQEKMVVPVITQDQLLMQGK
jgi:hypothetical protein